MVKSGGGEKKSAGGKKKHFHPSKHASKIEKWIPGGLVCVLARMTPTTRQDAGLFLIVGVK